MPHVRELFDLQGRTALVTGGGRGIGRHVALGLAEAGADVCLASRKLENLESTCAEIEALGRRARAFGLDLAEAASVDALLGALATEVPRVDVLVNNAGIAWSAPTLDYPDAGWERVFAVNVHGPWRLTRGIARRMRDAGGGVILNVGSISAWRGAPDETQPVVAYNASKGAVASLTRDLAVKLAPHGIRVNGIAPGPFLTDMMNHVRHDPERLRDFESTIPLRRSGAEADVKGAAVFLCSDAAAFVTGHMLVVDGGQLCVY